VSSRGQATVEFSLVAVILLLTFFAIVDFGRMVAIHSAVVTASREAARYGSAVGIDALSGEPQYVDCAGIRNAARRVVGGLIAIPDGDIVITYDRDADNDGTFATVPVDCGDEADVVSFDRVVVQVTATYRPITPFLQSVVAPITVVSLDRRTVVKGP
jgi:Flp pilus assembly protein TadG